MLVMVVVIVVGHDSLLLRVVPAKRRTAQPLEVHEGYSIGKATPTEYDKLGIIELELMNPVRAPPGWWYWGRMASASASLAFANRIDRLNAAIGRIAAWACVLVVVTQFSVVVLRYVFGVGSIWLSESVIYAHGTLFMLAAAWTLREGGHVRVDVFYADFSPRSRALVDFCGALLLLLPFMLVLGWFSLPYVARSWSILETSRETSGIPAVFLLKTLIPLFALLMALQGVSQAIRAWCVLRGRGGR
jgi:TRAP-type mannitol/chloroaromatic compound transport system permease small subunit